ncbi:Protein ACL-5, isoform b [Trichuris trichiura]|uniref:Protein ACL-5, isoform b n=1 Tax=Trichuris trichiura TaxID=36087 RepID=A0A077Z0N5_TRITR|nr:Protein ACL-5, isoform b [Trichuris trichiura]
MLFSGTLIEREASKRVSYKIYEEEPSGDLVHIFFEDSLDFIKAGMEAVIEDEVTSRFSSAELTTWNLLTRTKLFSWKLSLVWTVGLIFRYCVLFPTKCNTLVILSIILICSTLCSQILLRFKRQLSRKVSLICYRLLLQACSGAVTFHNRENAAKPGGICVANHTSPIDALILASNNCYALVGQKQGSFLGFLQNCLSRLESHIWFEREEISDKLAVRKRLLEHVEDKDKLPILIFPEGTCVNNTSVMMFKKGSFEVCNVIYPVAIKYDARFGDAFWNSSRVSYFEYLMMMMTSWALVCDVWYLPPMTRAEGENSIQFASRVKKAIAKAGGLVELEWDGMLKRNPVKRDVIENQRKKYSERIKKMHQENDNIEDEEEEKLVRTLTLLKPKRKYKVSRLVYI